MVLSILGAIVVIGVFSAIAANSSNQNSNGVSRGVGAQDASGDVTLGSWNYDALVGVVKAPVTVTNHSTKRSDYDITLALETADGKTQPGSAVLGSCKWP